MTYVNHSDAPSQKSEKLCHEFLKFITMTNKDKKISLEEVKKIAGLARIEISAEEAKKFSGELSDVLGYVDQLSEVDTEDVEPISQVTGLVNVVREDVSEDFDEEMKRELIERAGERKDNYIKVKSVM